MRSAWLAIAALLPAASVSAKTLDCRELPILVRYYTSNHYVHDAVTPELESRAAKLFVKGLDPSRTLLLRDDAAALERKIKGVLGAAGTTGCSPLDEALALTVSRSEADLAEARAFLDEDYKLDKSVSLAIDPEARGWPESAQAREDLLHRMLHFQMSSYLTAGLEFDKAKKQLVHRYELALKRAQERAERKKGPELYASAFALALDPHSSFLSDDDLEDFRISMRLSLEGIGAALRTEDGFTYIESLIPGGAAERTDALQPKDKIIAVTQSKSDPVSTIDMSIRDVVKLIRGPKGTEVTLTILREGKSTRTFDVTIVRDKIDVAQSAAKLDYEERMIGDRKVKIGVLELPSFYGGGNDGGRSSYKDVRRLVAEAVEGEVDGLVLDISRNGGGLLEDAVRISGLFLRRGGVVATKSTDGDVEVLEDDDPRIQYNGPLAVLISPVSASGSEILAGALKSYDRAVIVGGPRTFGKGTVQAVLPLPQRLGATKVTTGMFFIPDGASTQSQGVTAHVNVPSLMSAFDLGEDDLDYALAPQSVDPFVSVQANRSGAGKWVAVDEKKLRRLQARSDARVGKSSDFKEIKEQLESSDDDVKEITISEVTAESAKADEDGPGDEPAKARMERLHEAFTDEGVDVLVDLMRLQPSVRTAQN